MPLYNLSRAGIAEPTTYNFSGVAVADIPLGTAFAYRLEYFFSPSTDNVSLSGQVTNDAFSTVESGAGLYSYYDDRRGTGGNAVSSSNSASSITFQNPIGNAAGEAVAGEMTIYKPSDATQYTHFRGKGNRLNAVAEQNMDDFSATYRVAEAINGLRLAMSSGNLTGTVIVTSIG